MAVMPAALRPNHYVGLSTDTKPATLVDAGSTFKELDTGATFTYSGTAWYSDAGERDIKNAVISVAAASGDTQVVAAVTGKKIRLITSAFTTDTACTIKFRDNTGTPIDLTGGMACAQYGGAVLRSERKIGETATGKALMINTSVAATVGGYVEYEEVD